MTRPVIQAVSFDVGGTLIEPWPSVGHVYAAVAEEAGLGGADPATLSARFKAAWSEKRPFDYQRHSWAELVISTFDGTQAVFGAESPFFSRLYDRFTQADVWRIYDDVRPALERLRSMGFPLAVISNWDERLRPLLRNLRLDEYFQHIEVSGESGFHKPAPEIFGRAAGALRIEPTALLHVGDSPREDVEGARGAGLRAVLLSRDGQAGSGELASLAELPGLVSAWPDRD